MTTLGNSVKVGLAALLAVALFGGMWVFFTGNGLFGKPYHLYVLFNDASGILKDSPVNLAGVPIGHVSAVTLTSAQKAKIELEINKKYPIPQGSQFTVSTPLLSGSGVVTVVPPKDAALRSAIPPNTANLVGTQAGDITASLTKANKLIDQLTVTTQNANALLMDRRLQANLQQSAANVNAASANGVKLTKQLNSVLAQDNAEAVRLLRQDNAQVQGLLAQTRTGSQLALNNVVATTAEIKGTTKENRAQLRQIVANLNDTTAAVAGITGQTNDLLKNGDVTKNLSATVANLKATTDKLNAIAGNFQSLTGDPAVQTNLKQTLQNVRDTSEEARLLLARFNKLAGTKRPGPAVIVGPGGAVVIPPVTPGKGGTRQRDNVPFLLPRVDLVQNTRASHFRVDVDAFVPLSLKTTPGAFARVGLYGLGDNNKLNLQYGQMTGPASPLDYRYGLYAGKLSVGGDYGLARRESLSFDLYDPNAPHLDARGVIMLAPELGLMVGGEDLLRRGGGIIGLEYRRSK